MVEGVFTVNNFSHVPQVPNTRPSPSLAKRGPGSSHPGPTSPFSLRMSRLNSFPSKHRKSSPGVMMPHLVAMARAVLTLSPVTILTVMPARLHLAIASGTCGGSGKRRGAAGDAGEWPCSAAPSLWTRQGAPSKQCHPILSRWN